MLDSRSNAARDATRVDRPTFVFLPGMHGTADLLRPFIAVLPLDQPYRVVEFPRDRYLSYDELLAMIEAELATELAGETDLVVIGESFGGPLAIRFGERHADRVRAVVLSGSFVRPPLPSWLRWLVGPWVFRLPLPSFAVRIVVAGARAPQSLVDLAKTALRAPTPAVMAGRARDALTVNCTDALQAVRSPILYLFGERDWLVWPFNLARILAVRPDVTVRRFDAPHLILQTMPHEGLDAIYAFAGVSVARSGPDTVGRTTRRSP